MDVPRLFTLGGDPVDTEYIRRPAVERQVLGVAKSPGAKAFLADIRQVGKTWLVKMAFRLNPKVPKLLFLDAQEGHAGRLCENLLMGAVSIFGKDMLRQPAALPLAGAALEDGGFAFQWSPALDTARNTFWRLFDAIGQLASRTPFCMVIDEIQDLPAVLGPDALGGLRSHLQKMNKISCLFMGSKKTLIERMFIPYKDEPVPLFNVGTRVDVENISEGDWQVFLAESFRFRDLRADDTVIQKILETTGGHAGYTKHLCNYVFSVCAKRVDARAVEQARAKLMDSLSPGFRTRWASYGGKYAAGASMAVDRAVLESMAVLGGAHPFSAEFVRDSGLTASKIESSLVRLVNMGEIAAPPTGTAAPYEIADPMYRDWLAGRRRPRR